MAKISATSERLEKLIAEEKSLTSEIEQRVKRREAIRKTLEAVKLALQGQQMLPGCEEEKRVKAPGVSQKLTVLQRHVLGGIVAAAVVHAPWIAETTQEKRAATTLATKGLIEPAARGAEGQYFPTQAGIDLHEEYKTWCKTPPAISIES